MKLSLRRVLDFESGSVSRRVLALAWPAALEQGLLALVGLVNVYLVGALGTAAIAGVGLGTQLVALVAALFSALGLGAAMVVAREVGAQQRAEASAVAGQGLLAAAAGGLAAAVLALPLAPVLIGFFGGEPVVQRDGAIWLRAAALGLPFVGLMLVGNAVLRGAGDTRAPLVITVTSNTLNMGLAWALTIWLDWNVAGNGLAFSISYLCGGLMLVAVLVRRKEPFVAPRDLRMNWPRIRRIVNVGIPAGVEQLLLHSALAFSAVLITGFGTAAYAAHQIVGRLLAIASTPAWGLSVAGTILVGQALGARSLDGGRAAASRVLAFSIAGMSLTGLLLFVFAEAIVRSFSTDIEVVSAGVLALRISALTQPLLAYSGTYSSALRGAGDTRATLLVTAGSVWIVRIAMIYWLGDVLGMGLSGAWMALGVDYVVRCVLFTRRWRSGRWGLLRI